MKLFTFLFLSFFIFSATAQNREKAFEINERLGRGINYGNMFEAPTETAWGNQWKPEYAGIIADLGFDHVRIPIRWEPSNRSMAVPPYTIYPEFLNRIKQVVDSALNNELHAIINMHHHEALYADPAAEKARFLSQWKQIADFFQDYPDSLLFEILNEPHGNISPQVWNDLVPEVLDTIRTTNPERVVLIGTANYGGLGGLPELEIPEDENIILTVHYYNPFQFTHQGASWVGGDADAWLGTEWHDSETEREVMRQDFAPLAALSQAENIPVHIGEFGAYSTADMTSRAKWTTFLSRYFEEQGWSWAYWEFSAGFGIYNPSTKTFNQPLVDALLHNEMPEPAHYEGTTVYASSFQSNNNGWNINTQQSAVAQLSRADNQLTVSITNGGSEGWHVQLVKNNMTLRQGKKYRFSFKAKADTARSVTSYIGMNSSPWSAYSGYNSVSLADTFAVYTFIFDMTSATDNSARMVFDLGRSSKDFTVTEILLEEIVLVPPSSAELLQSTPIRVYPNPFNEIIRIDNAVQYHSARLIDLHGKTIITHQVNGLNSDIRVPQVQPGIYFLVLEGATSNQVVKLVKQ